MGWLRSLLLKARVSSLVRSKLFWVVVVALTIRLAICPFTGQTYDIVAWYNAAWRTVDRGENVYQPEVWRVSGTFCYPAAWLYVISLMYFLWEKTPFYGGEIVQIEQVKPALPFIKNYWIVFLFKIPLIIADFAVGYLLYKIASEHWSGRELLVLSLWLFNPFVLIVDAWGHFDVISVLFSLLACYALTKRRYILSAVALGLGITFKMYPIILLPLLAVYAYKVAGLRGLFKYLAVVAAVLLVVNAPYLIWDYHSFFWAILSMPYTGWTAEGYWGYCIWHVVKHVTWLMRVTVAKFPFSETLALALLATTAIHLWRYPDPEPRGVYRGALAVVLAFYAVNRIMTTQYMLWFLPFLLIDVLVFGRSLLFLTIPTALVFSYFVFVESFFFRSLLTPVYQFHGTAIEHFYESWDYAAYYHSQDWEEYRAMGLTGLLFAGFCITYIYHILRGGEEAVGK